MTARPALPATDTALQTAAQTDDARWRAVQAKDGAHDGEFWFAVRTTGIFCRPSCPSRAPRRENVRFFDSPAAARAAGFRACLRCRPEAAGEDHPHADAVRRAIALADRADAPLSLGELADAAGLSRFHFARVFKALTGVTPMAWQRARRGERFGRALQSGATVTAAIYDAGFNSPSRVYEGGAAFAMTPSAYRRRGAGETLRIATAPCALGTVVVAATAKGVCAIELGDDAAALESRVRARFSGATFIAADAQFDAWIAAVVRHLDRARGALELPLDLRGTAFQQRVWQALREIPAGSTASYAEVARRIGAPKAARGVAQACAANPAAVAVPCHRVVRGDGALGGYRWGLERKRQLLDDESGD